MGESLTVQSLTKGGDAAATRVRTLRGEEQFLPRRSLPGAVSGGLAATPLRSPLKPDEPRADSECDSRLGLTAISHAWSFEKGRRTTPPFSFAQDRNLRVQISVARHTNTPNGRRFAAARRCYERRHSKTAMRQPVSVHELWCVPAS